MDAISRLEAWITRSARVLASIGFLGLLLICMAVTVDILLRKFANAPIRGLGDFQELIGVVAVASCFPLVCAERGCISFRFLGTSLGERAALWFDAFGSALLLLFVALIGWQLTIYTGDLLQSGRTTSHLNMPVAPCWILATALTLLCIPVQLAALVQDVVRAVSNTAPASLDGQAMGEGAL